MRWLVLIVVVYAALQMLRSGLLRSGQAVPAGKAPTP